MPDVDGITTDEDCLVHGGPVMRAWHELRFAQRHQLMSSLGLGRRLLARRVARRLTLTHRRVADRCGRRLARFVPLRNATQ